MKKFHYYLCVLGFCVLSVPTQINAQDLVCAEDLTLGTLQDQGINIPYDFFLDEDYPPDGISINLVNVADPTDVYSGTGMFGVVDFFNTGPKIFDFTISDFSNNVSCTGTLTTYIVGACVDTMNINFVNNVGIDQMTVDVELMQDQDIQSLQWTLEYDPDLLSLSDISEGAMSNIGLFSTNEFEPGLVNFVWLDAVSDPNYVGGSVLFSFEFDVLQNGTSTVGIFEGLNSNAILTEGGDVNQNRICIGSSPSTVTANGAQLEGNISRLDNFDCSGSNSIALQDWIVKIANNSEEYFTSTDENGYYNKIVEPGDYTVTAYPYSVMWDFCNNDIDISLPNVGDELTVDFTANAELSCSYLEVDLYTPFLRRCFENTYYLDYCNQGTAIANDAYIEVELDEALTLLTASVPFTQVGQLVSFDLGNVDLECGWISFVADLSCDVELGETHCTTATIFPQDPCNQAFGDWEGPVIDVTAECDGDSIRFTVSNTGIENMLTTAGFIVVEDDVMREIGDFQLNALESVDYGFLAEGSTLRFFADQPIGFPNEEFATAYVEGCSTDVNGNFSTGFINDYPLGDFLPYVDTDCQENIGSYDPNDKVSFPKGYGEEHYVKNNQTIDYKIRFQNTGTDTAFRVVVVDTLSEFLDISTLKRTTFSHANEMTIEDRVVSFTFNNIQLVDSTKNEIESHGFVSFQIEMIDDLIDGTIINNSADIYFDFNDPITTNITFLEIGSDFIDETSLSTIDNPENIIVQIVPNPTTSESIIRIKDVNDRDVQIQIYNVIGKLVAEGEVENNLFDLSGIGLSEGTYILKLVDDKKKVFSSKLIVH